MALKAEYSPRFAHFSTRRAPRRLHLRELAGWLQAVAAALLLVALAGERSGAAWLGPPGTRTARAIFFAFGEYASFVIPLLMGAGAWRAIFREATVLRQSPALLRAAGGLTLLIALSGLITLHAGYRRWSDPVIHFNAGGLVGSFIIDREGLNLVRQAGRPGGFLLLYGGVLGGLAMFAGTFLRESARRARLAIGKAAEPGALTIATAGLLEPAANLYEVVRVNFLDRALAAFRFRRHAQGRILAPNPIKEITFASGAPAALPAPVRRLEDLREPADPWAGPEEDAEPAALEREDLFREEPAARVIEAPELPLPAEEAEAYISDPSGDPGPDWDVDLAGAAPAIFSRQRRNGESAGSVEPGGAPVLKRKYETPPLDHLADPPSDVYEMTPEERAELSRRIEETLAQFKIEVQVAEVVQGPTVTRFALRIAPGIRVSRITALENDLALALKAQHVRILAPIPGQAAVGIEVPNKRTNPVFLRELLESEAFGKSKSPLAFALGKNISGEAVIADLAQMPHLLIAGATGSGKSVCLNTIIASMLFRNPPDKVKFIMIDPKRVELSVYQAIPHLLAPVVCEPRKASAALQWTVEQMEQRYKLLAEIGVRNIDGYNAIVNDTQPNKKAMGRELKYMNHIVVVIDELADLMMVAKNEVEEYVIRLAQLARAVGIHLIVATQRPSVNVITGLIKANFPSRIAFRVSSKVDSRTILDMNGAEALLGRGDMLYSPGGVKPFRIQGAFVSDNEIERVADHIRAQEKAQYVKEDFEPAQTPSQRAKQQILQQMGNAAAEGGRAHAHVMEDSGEDDGFVDERPYPLPAEGRVNAAPLPPADMESLTDDDLFEVALRIVLESRKASVSYIQRRLKIGYARAGRVMDMMEERGIVGPYQGSKPRDLIVDPEEFMRRRGETGEG